MKKIKKFINKNKEFISYCFFGGLTTILNLLLFWVLNIFFKYYVANIITLIVIKTLTYLLNKFFVFKTRCKSNKELIKEILEYIASRLFTLLIDYFGLILIVEVFNINKIIGKIIVLIIVVIINYSLCKRIYKKENRNE